MSLLKKIFGGAPEADVDVLVVDDDPEICSLIQTLLSIRKLKVHVAHNGRLAMEWLETSKPRLMILDVVMPEMNGQEVLSELARRPRLADLPVMMVTSMAEGSGHNDQEWARKMGVRRFLSKPFETEDLLLAVDEILGTGESSVDAAAAESSNHTA